MPGEIATSGEVVGIRKTGFVSAEDETVRLYAVEVLLDAREARNLTLGQTVLVMEARRVGGPA